MAAAARCWAGTCPKTLAKTDAIYDTLLKIFAMAEREKIPTYQAADRLAEERFMARRRNKLSTDAC